MWKETKNELPKENIPVLTKIEDENGTRNEGILIRVRRLWFMQDMKMYVYYTPTHWKLK